MYITKELDRHKKSIDNKYTYIKKNLMIISVITLKKEKKPRRMPC